VPIEVADPSLDQLVGVLRREAFVGLLRGAPVTVTHVAGERELPRHRVRAALDQLVAAGAAELDGERIVGAHGLTARTTRHAIGLDERVLHTWCALDAVGIPVALGLDTIATTTCPTCGTRLAVPVRGGRATPLSFVLWLPTGPCRHLTRDFCSAANLFCDAAHAENWRRRAGNQQGRVVSLPEVEDIARRSWADVADAGPTVPAADTAHHDTEA
jgi:alkylmercury lyase